MCSCGNGSKNTLELFIEDIIVTWKLLLPTIVVDETMVQLCKSLPRALCLVNNNDLAGLSAHFEVLHKSRKQDGIIFVSDGQSELLQQLDTGIPAIFRSNYPIFMPLGNSDDIKLRLDSNIMFFKEENEAWYSLVDMFSVKGGLPIKLEFAKWTTMNGFEFERSHNRWDRRRDLRGAKFFNCFGFNRRWAEVTRDEAGKINGSEGYFQDILFIVLNRLNLTIVTMEPYPNNKNRLLENGSWTGVMGSLQRKETDIGSSGMGMSLQRVPYVEFPHKTSGIKPTPITLIAAIPKEKELNMWTFVRVFGVVQWSIFFSFMALFVIMMTAMHLADERGHAEDQMGFLASAIATAYLFAIQLGDHPDLKGLKSKCLIMTMSWMTLLMFIYYSGEITAEMTSGPGSIPVRTYEDVIKHEYKVISASNYYMNLLKSAPNDSAKHQVYIDSFVNAAGMVEPEENKSIMYTAMKAIVDDPKKLLCGAKTTLARSSDVEEKQLSFQLMVLN